MDTKLLEKVTTKYKRVKHPDFRVGDIIEVHSKIKEGGKERIQIFKGIVLAIKGSGTSRTFTVRKISYGIGVERIYPLYSPSIAKIKIVKRGKVKRSKLYYLRKRVGKVALKPGVQVPAEGKDLESRFLEEVKEKQEEVSPSKDSSQKKEKEKKEGEEDQKEEAKKSEKTSKE